MTRYDSPVEGKAKNHYHKNVNLLKTYLRVSKFGQFFDIWHTKKIGCELSLMVQRFSFPLE
jgi:hypothetical protein